MALTKRGVEGGEKRKCRGNHYGTPKPSKEQPVSPPQSSGSSSNLNIVGLTLGGLFPGAHPSSEGKRKRNRSNVEAMAAKNMEPELIGGNLLTIDQPVELGNAGMITYARCLHRPFRPLQARCLQSHNVSVIEHVSSARGQDSRRPLPEIETTVNYNRKEY
uniref:Uncharacterized protein n=1 Tax=Timema douglasi TaxID=61478 RepID=A0A7R8Z9L0_TIMDO|nr:unnamed protein product [Timema douglasi]